MIDQHLSRYFGQGSTLSVALLQNMMALPSLLIMMMIAGVPAYPGLASLLWIGTGAAVSMLALIPYLRALQIDEARNTSPLFEFTPVFVMLMAWAVLGETMTVHQMAGALIVISCGFLFVWDFNHNRIKRQTLLLMLASSFLYAFNQLAMRYVSQDMNPWDVAIFFSAGCFISGIILSVCQPQAVQNLVKGVRKGKGVLMAMAVFEETLSRVAFVCLVYAFALAPTAGHVAALSAVHPVFVMILAMIIGSFSHHHFPKVSWDRDTKIKCVLLAGIVGGIYLLRSG